VHPVDEPVLAHGARTCILPTHLYWPMAPMCTSCRHACIGPQCSYMYSSEKLVLAHGVYVSILPTRSYWPMASMCSSCRRACIGPWYILPTRLYGPTVHIHVFFRKPILDHAADVHILPTNLYWPMVLLPEFCRKAHIGPWHQCVHPTDELVLARGALACTLPKARIDPWRQCVHPADLLVLTHGINVCILPTSLHWSTMLIHVFFRKARIDPLH